MANPSTAKNSSGCARMSASLPLNRTGSAFQRCDNIRLHDVVDELLAGAARLGVVTPAIRDVVGHHADAEERDLKQAGNLSGRCGLHLFSRGAELVVETLDAIQFAVPDL